MRWEEQVIQTTKRAIQENGWVEIRVRVKNGRKRLLINYYPQKEEIETEEFVFVE